MKKLVALGLTLVCVLALLGCTKADTAAAHSLSDYLVEEEGKQYLILPMSQTRIPVGDDFKQFTANIEVDLLIAAEEKISDRIRDNEDSSGFYLKMDGGDLCLCAEIIEKIDPPQKVTTEDGDVMDAGCNIDHKHIFLSERITK